MQNSPAPVLGALAAPSRACAHCGNPIPGSRQDGFCCTGCRAVFRLMQDAGLGRYYELKPARLAPMLGYFDAPASLAWIANEPGLRDGRLELSVEGIQCGACVWAIEQLAARAGARVGVNSALGRLSLRFDPARFQAQAWLEGLGHLGYRVQKPGAAEKDPSRGLLIRLGLCAAIAMNTMSFSLPFYFGLTQDGDGISRALRLLNLGLTALAVVIGGGYFFGRAWQALKRGVAHFDIPVALGILGVFSGSLWGFWKGADGSVYFDTLNVFITLMLLGRYLQERALLKNRRALLQGDAFDAGQVTLLDPGPRDLAFRETRSGMRLLLQPGALLPVDSELEGPAGDFDLASITGELRPACLGPGARVRAGARLVSDRAVKVVALTDFDASQLAGLVPPPAGDEELPVIWRWSVRYYLAFVMLAALGGLGFWLWRDPSMAGRVFISTLVITCPCGLGIAVPLARTKAMRQLGAMGLTLRQGGVLDRLHGVERVYLDKTGTLTFTHLELQDPARLSRLAPQARAALLGASAGSRHPISRALSRELCALGVPYPAEGQAQEIPGQGVRFSDALGDWFLGRSMDEQWSSAGAVLSLDGVTVMAFELKERLLEDAQASVAALKALGLKVALLSGDHPSRVREAAKALGLSPSAALAGCSPSDKAAVAAAEPCLMLGDGLNDGSALSLARVSGTPSWERSSVADRADFSFNSGSLAWLPRLFVAARRLRRVLWFNLVFAWTYNLVMVSLALQGKLTPLICALVMPLSSLLVIALSSRVMGKA